MTEQTNIKTERSNTALWLLLASFLVPAFLAYGYYFLGDRPDISSNGELISPVIDIETLRLTNESGEQLDRETLTPRWRLYYLVTKDCNEQCQQDLFNIRQINKALGKNQGRMEHVIVHLEHPTPEFEKLIKQEHTTAQRAYVASHQTVDGELPWKQKEYFYLMDPLGNVMMRFEHTLNPKLILKDINKLLKISRIG